MIMQLRSALNNSPNTHFDQDIHKHSSICIKAKLLEDYERLIQNKQTMLGVQVKTIQILCNILA